MRELIENLRGALAFDYEQGAPVILVAKSRSQGRRMLQWLTRERGALVNVTVETPATLATAICAGRLSQPGAPTVMQPSEAMNLIRILLGELKSGYYSGRTTAQTASAATLFYYTFQELALAGIGGFPGSDGGKLDSTQQLREDYNAQKKELKLLDAGDVMALAIQEADKCIQYRGAKFVTLDCYEFTPLEQALLQKISGGALHTVALAQGHHRTGQNSRFVACRGVENEVDFLFRDILDQKKSIEDCAVVYLSSEYGEKLWNAAHRWSVPVSMVGGLRLGETALCGALSVLAQWGQEGYPIARLYGLLTDGSLGPKQASRLAGLLARKTAFMGQQLYTLTDVTKPKGLDDAVWEKWGEFLTLIVEAVDGEKLLMEQKIALQRLLSRYVPRRTPNQIAVCATVQNLVETAYTAAIRLKGVEDISLLEHLIHLMERASYLPAPTVAQKGDANLLCMPLYQALLSGRSTLYVVGLSRYALEQGGAESPVLLDGERELVGGLATVASRAKQRREAFDQLLSTHGGEMIFSYTDYDSVGMIDRLPSPAYVGLLANCGGVEEKIDYIPTSRLVTTDALLNGEDLAGTGAPLGGDASRKQVEIPTMEDVIKGFRFSASSMELAYGCPLKFYLSRILNIQQDNITPKENRWLIGSTLGTAAHEILEDYFAAVVAGTPVVAEDLVKAKQKYLKDNFPCYTKKMENLREEELALLAQFVKDAITVYDNSNFQVCATEQPFGDSEDGGGGLELQLGNRVVRLKGSIDRVDRDKTTGEYHILDYKSTQLDRFMDKAEEHLQHYLYTLVYEKLYGQEGHKVVSAHYQLLRDGGAYNTYPQGAAERANMESKLTHLLDVLGDEDKIQTAIPCYRLIQGAVAVDNDKRRRSARKDCAKYCEYSAFCASEWEVNGK